MVAITNNRFRIQLSHGDSLGRRELMHLGSPDLLPFPSTCLAPPTPAPGLVLVSLMQRPFQMVGCALDRAQRVFILSAWRLKCAVV